jgi:sugar lactone lactonase YvrE
MGIRSNIKAVLTLVVTMSLAGCGGGGGGAPVAGKFQMGGAQQGVQVALAGTVTTFAGTAGRSVDDPIGTNARFNNPRAVTADATNLYIADSVNNTIRKIVIATGAVTTLAGTPGVAGSTDTGIGTPALFNNPCGITNDGLGNLYVADTGNHTIRKVIIASGAVSTLAGTAGVQGAVDATGAAASFNSPRGITTDGNNLYVADTENATIRAIVIANGTVGAVSTLAGTAGFFGADDGDPSDATFNSPGGITTTGGLLYVADTGNGLVRTVDLGTGEVGHLAPSFTGPTGVGTDGANLYVADAGNQTVSKIDLSAPAVAATLAGTAGAFGSTDAPNGPGTAARFADPYDVAFRGGFLYVIDSLAGTVRSIEVGTGKVATLAGAPSFADAVTGPAAGFDYPIDVTTDGINLYVADAVHDTIRKIVISSGAVTTIAGTAGATGSADNAVGTAAMFDTPSGITTDGTNLYVTDQANNTIRKIVIASGAVSTLAGTVGVAGSTDSNNGLTATFNNPTGITTDGTNLYVTDSFNAVIRKINIASGAVTTLAGTAGVTGAADNVNGLAATFSNPAGITTDGTSLYVADADNNTIRKIVIASSAVTTLAGTAGTSGSTDATGITARFNSPYGITTDGANLYVTDSLNSTIRKIVIATGAATTVAGTPGTTGSTNTPPLFNVPGGITTDGISLYVADSGNGTIRRIQ